MKWLFGALKFTLSLVILLSLSCIPVSFGCPGANQPPTATIDSITPDTPVVGTVISFTGHGTDPNGTVVAYRWRSNLDGEIGTSATFEKPGLSAGTHVIYLKVQDNNGAWSNEENKTIIVAAAGSVPPPPEAPVINQFVSDSDILRGAYVTLSWNVSNATSITISPTVGSVAATGSRQVTPASTTIYTLTATNTSGSANQTLQVTVPVSHLTGPGLTGTVTPLRNFVTSVTARVSPDTWSGTCPYSFYCSAAISASGPCTVTYIWERSDLGSSPQQTVVFTTAATKSVNTDWPREGSGSHWVRVRILTPNEMVSEKANFTLNCQPFAVTNVNVLVNPKDFTGGCPKSFGLVGNITANGEGTVTYRWERSDGGSSPTQTYTFAEHTSMFSPLTTWPREVSGSYWVRIRILSPNSMVSDPVNFTLNCSP